MMELECAKLETRLSQMHTNPQKRRRKSRKTRWDLEGLENETRYLDNLARKALSPLSLYPAQKPVDFEEDYSHYPKIREPHRIGERVRIVEVPSRRQPQRKSEPSQDFSFMQPIGSSSRMQNSLFERSFQKENLHSSRMRSKQTENNFIDQNSMEKKKKHHHQHSTVKINRIIANPTPPQRKKNKIILGDAPKAGLDTELDEFVDHISDFGKWND